MILHAGIRLFASLALPSMAGYALLNLIFRKNKLDFLTTSAISYGLGMGILTQCMFLLGAIGMEYSAGTIGVFLVIFAIFFSFFSYKKAKKNYSFSKSVQTLAADKSATTTSSVKILHRVLYILFSVYIIYYIFYVFWRSLNIPIYTWDAIATIAFKGKIFFFEKSLSHLKNLPHCSYPIHIPLIQSWIALNLGEWNDQFIKIIFPFTFLSFIIIYNHFLSHYTNRTWTLLGIVMLISSNLFILHATISYRDFSLLYYNCTTIIFLLLWNSRKEDAFLILSALFAGFATFIKLEGTAYLVIYTILFFLILLFQKANSFRENFNKFLKFAIPSFGICFFYHFYKIFTEVPTQEKIEFDFTYSNLYRIPIIFKSFAGNLFLSGNWNIIWFLLVLSLVLNFAKIKKKIEISLLFMTLIMFFGIYFFNALLTTNFIWIAGIKSATGLSRLILHFFPLSVLLLILLNYPEKPVINKNSTKP